jgi:hypothetical protein
MPVLVQIRGKEMESAVVTIQQRQASISGSLAKRISKEFRVSLLFIFIYFRSSARRRLPLQFDLIVFNGGTDEIL